jgi:hypothetical protein
VPFFAACRRTQAQPASQRLRLTKSASTKTGSKRINKTTNKMLMMPPLRIQMPPFYIICCGFFCPAGKTKHAIRENA